MASSDRLRRARATASSDRDLLTAAATIGAIGAGAVLLEAAVVPGLAVVGAALVARRLAPRLRRLAKAPSLSLAPRGKFAITQATAKTITFRVIVTATDFSWNTLILGDPAAAAGLSTISLIAGPFFYFLHETAWNGFGVAFMRKAGFWRASADPTADAQPSPAPRGWFTVDKALAKTITFRVFATTNEYAVNYVVTRDAMTAAALTAPGFFLGPFIYLGHEKVWEHYGAPKQPLSR